MRATLSLVWVSILLLGCAEPARPPAALTGIRALDVPAGEGSEEPHLSTHGDAVFLSWLEPGEDEAWALRLATLRDRRWSEPVTVAVEGDAPFFVNWADFPSVVADAGGTLWAHWLQRGPGGGYDYGIRVSSSADGGATWSAPWTPHDDGTPTEHGFLSFFPVDGRMGMIWLDGRKFAPGPQGEPATREMTLRYRSAAPGGGATDEVVVDGRICDCCVTDAVVTPAGPVVAYRNRTEDEIRDIYVTRLVDGAWTVGRPVHDDGWHIAGCPVNGPALASGGADVVLAWFTGAGNVPRVWVAFSSDAGASFGDPVRVDDGNPAGRVDVVRLSDGSALVSWLERTGEGLAEIRVRRVGADGSASDHSVVSRTSSARATGFPQMVREPSGTVLFAWTDPEAAASRIRLVRATPGAS